VFACLPVVNAVAALFDGNFVVTSLKFRSHLGWRRPCLLRCIEMTRYDDEREEAKACERCGGRAVYRPTAIVPGNPLAPRGSRSAESHPQPAWQCIECGHLVPHDRRVSRSAARQTR
jgi:hypothetical protein